MNDEFITNALANGEKGKLWLEKLPEVIKAYEEKWSLKALPPYILSYHYVAPVVRNDGSRAVIKIGMVWDKEFLNEEKALQVFNGDGAPKVLRADLENAVILIEEITPGTPLSTITDDDTATEILASVMQKIWKSLPKNHSFITLFDWTKELREYPSKATNIFPLDLAKEGIQLFEYLLKTSQPAVLTHADLHHDNILKSTMHEWAAIDPKGIAAEPLYDVAAQIRNPYKKLKVMNNTNLDALLKRRIHVLAHELNADKKRIYQWCLAQTILSGVWTIDNKEYTDYALKIIYSLKRIQGEF